MHIIYYMHVDVHIFIAAWLQLKPNSLDASLIETVVIVLSLNVSMLRTVVSIIL